jgi:peptidoglycan/xylan/chitin deacetylase (PgdA/CDA1 family)
VNAILTYHDIQRRPTAGITSVSPQTLRAQIVGLAAREFAFVPVETLLSAGEDRRRIAICFDDAFDGQLQQACDTLLPHRIPAIAAVITDYVGRAPSWDYAGHGRRHADWTQLRDWCDAGMGVASHGCTHRDLRSLPDPALARELTYSRSLLEERLQRQVRTLVYPFGRYDRRVVAAARAAGYRIGMSTRPGTCGGDPLTWPRLVVSRLDTLLSIERRLSRTLWGGVERTKQRIISYWAGGTPHYQRLRAPDRIRMEMR